MPSKSLFICHSLLTLLFFCPDRSYALPLNVSTLQTQASPGPGIVISGCTPWEQGFIQTAYSKYALWLAQKGLNYPARNSAMSAWFFGSFGAHKDFVNTVFQNACDFILTNQPLRISCQDIPNKEGGDAGTSCATQRENSLAGAYALNDQDIPTLVVCPGTKFFVQPGLEELWSTYNRGNLSKRKGVDLSAVSSKGGTLLHEMMHLDGVTRAEDHIIDKIIGTHRFAYGPKQCKKLARVHPDEAHHNADSYIWYATGIFFESGSGITPQNPSSKG